jgi:hypothetical protein
MQPAASKLHSDSDYKTEPVSFMMENMTSAGREAMSVVEAPGL